MNARLAELYERTLHMAANLYNKDVRYQTIVHCQVIYGYYQIFYYLCNQFSHILFFL